VPNPALSQAGPRSAIFLEDHVRVRITVVVASVVSLGTPQASVHCLTRPSGPEASEAPVTEPLFVPLAVAVVTISDTRDLESDTSGALIAELLGGAGHALAQRQLIKDDLPVIRALFAALIADPGVQVVISTGGTGITARDVTIEALNPLVSKPIEGFGELFRWLSFAEIGASTIQSRTSAALCDKTLVFALPGSRGAVRLAMERIILPQLDRRTRPCNFTELMPRF
jgi:molybdenum cofactor biosynthesis protein B